MFSYRHLLLVTLLAGAVAVPYLSSSEQGQKLWGSLTGGASHDSDSAPSHLASTTAITPPAVLPAEGGRHAARDPAAPPRPPTHVEGVPPQTLEEVLRFDISPDWIIERWPRVSSGLSELDLQGYRVALVTGTAESDLAGSLTYYFNKKNQVDRDDLSRHQRRPEPARDAGHRPLRIEEAEVGRSQPDALSAQMVWQIGQRAAYSAGFGAAIGHAAGALRNRAGARAPSAHTDALRRHFSSAGAAAAASSSATRFSSSATRRSSAGNLVARRRRVAGIGTIVRVGREAGRLLRHDLRRTEGASRERSPEGQGLAAAAGHRPG